MKIREIIDEQMPSISEWMEKIGLGSIEEFRQEDNNKRNRLEILHQTINLQYDRPEKLAAKDIKDKTNKFKEVIKRIGNEKCALRLVPTSPNLPKLRIRGKTLKDSLPWFFEQQINLDDYKAEIIPHNDETIYSSSFIINDDGIWGEIVPGMHWQLTQGFYEQESIIFKFNLESWFFTTTKDVEAIKTIKEAVGLLLIQKNDQIKLKELLQSEFTKDGYLKGYFEFVVWPKTGISFIDYNRVIYKMLRKASFALSKKTKETTELSGICVNPGTAQGVVKVISDPKNAEFNEGDIIVCQMTTINFAPLMQKAAAIVTEEGGLLSHAAIVARELKKPCLVGVKDATKKLRDGQIIEVNADKGTVKIIS